MTAEHLRNVQRAIAASIREIASGVSAEAEGVLEDGKPLCESRANLDAHVALLEDCASVLELVV